MTCELIVIGASAGGLVAISTLLESLPKDFPVPVVIVQHRGKDMRDLLEEVLQNKCAVRIRQAEEKEKPEGGSVYLAPPDYHLLMEKDLTFSLSSDAPVHYSRPSIDVLFESAAHACGEKLVGVILTGANRDGATGIAAIREQGGRTLAQDPDEAPFTAMPSAAIETGAVQQVLRLDAIAAFLRSLPDERKP